MKKILVIFALFVAIFNSNLLVAKRLVVLDPAIVEMLYLLNAQDNIVAIAKPTTSKIWPEEKTEKLISVGTYTKPNLEKIIELKPDLVITSFHSINTINELKKFNIDAMSMQANSVEDIYKNIKRIGELVDKNNEANTIINDLKVEFEKVATHSSLAGKKAVVLFSINPIMAFSNKALPGDILSKLKLENIVSDNKAQAPILSVENILLANPDFIIIIGTDTQKDSFLRTYPTLKSTTAAKNDKIISVSSSILLRGTPRIKDGIKKLFEQINK